MYASLQGTAQQQSWAYYRFDVTEADRQNLVVDLFALPGAAPNDLDLYVAMDANPTLDQYLCRSQNGGGEAEHCAIPNPQPATYVVGVNAFDVGAIPFALEANASAAAALGVKPELVRVGSQVTFTGSGITPATRLHLELATSAGFLDVLPEGLVASNTTETSWTGTVPASWPSGVVPSDTLGQGYAAATLVRTDADDDVSNVQGVVLAGNPSLAVPTITGLGGVPLARSSWDERYRVANVEKVVETGKTLTIQGDGFGSAATTRVNLFHTGGNCGPLTPSSATPTQLEVSIPAKSCVVGPGSIQVVNDVSHRASSAISVPLGAKLALASATVNGTTVTLKGAGFSSRTVLNLFAAVGGTVVNVGGLDETAAPRIPLTFVSATELRFTAPGNVDPGPADVELLNPPFLPYTTSQRVAVKLP